MWKGLSRWSTAGGSLLVLLLLAGCGGDAEQERVDLLASNPAASLESNCSVFLARVAERTDWKVVGATESKTSLATEEDVGRDYYVDGCQLGLLKVVMADKDKQETAFRFVFVSDPVYGTWILRKVGVIDAADKIQVYGGDTDTFYTINAEQGRHPSAG